MHFLNHDKSNMTMDKLFLVKCTCWSCCLYSSLWLFFMCLSFALALQKVMKHWKHCRFSCWSERAHTDSVRVLFMLVTLFKLGPLKHLQDWTEGAGGPFRMTGLYGSAGFSWGGTGGGGSGKPRPNTMSSMFKMSESILRHSCDTTLLDSHKRQLKIQNNVQKNPLNSSDSNTTCKSTLVSSTT